MCLKWVMILCWKFCYFCIRSENGREIYARTFGSDIFASNASYRLLIRMLLHQTVMIKTVHVHRCATLSFIQKQPRACLSAESKLEEGEHERAECFRLRVEIIEQPSGGGSEQANLTEGHGAKPLRHQTVMRH